ncbi:MAG: DUF2666 family protein [Candidatus Micrarchaeota archaeon]
MYGGDEIILCGEHKKFKAGLHYDLSDTDEKEVSRILGDVSSTVEPLAFEFSGIDTKAIDKFVEFDGKDVEAVAEYIQKNGSAWKKWAKEVLPNPKLIHAADSYLFNKLLSEAGIKFKVDGNAKTKPDNEEIGDVIAFVGRYKTWISIKKLGMDNVKDYEVSGILSGINHSVVNKSFEFDGSDMDDAKVQEITKGKRKSYGNAALCLRELGSADHYTICKVLEGIGFRPYASPFMLTEAYPDIKPPKVKGRKPKK